MKKNHRFAISWLPQSETRIGRHTDSKSGERIRNPNQLTLSDLVWSSALQPFDHIFDGYQTTGLDLVRHPIPQFFLLRTREPRPDGLRQERVGLDGAAAFRITSKIAAIFVQRVGGFVGDCLRSGERARQTRNVRYFT